MCEGQNKSMLTNVELYEEIKLIDLKLDDMNKTITEIKIGIEGLKVRTATVSTFVTMIVTALIYIGHSLFSGG